MTIRASRSIAQELYREGLVPEDCCDIQVHFPVDGAAVIEYRVFLTDERLAKVRRAFGRVLGMDPDAELPARGIRLAGGRKG